MPAASTAIAPRGGYNHASVYYLSPQTGSGTVGDISVLTAPTSGTIYALFDGTTPSFQCNTVRNYSAAAMTLGNVTASQKTVLRAGTSADIEFNPGGAKTATLTSAGSLAFASTSWTIGGATSDGADNAAMAICSSGSAGTGRGGHVVLYGNEHASVGGVEIYTGDAAGVCKVGTYGTGSFHLVTAGTTKWLVNTAGDLVPNIDLTYAIGGSGKYLNNIYLSGVFWHLNNINSSVSSGTGTIKMCGTTSRNSTGFVSFVDSGGTTRYIPFYDTITG